MLAATLQHHCDCQPEELGVTVKVLRENIYVDNLMKTGHEVEVEGRSHSDLRK